MNLNVISTGSHANLYALHAGDQTLLLDAGVSGRKLINSMPDWNSVCGCLVTHEHADHSRGVPDLLRMGVPVYASQGTIEAIRVDADLTRLKRIQALLTFTVGEFTVLPFSTKHDAAEPLGFIVRYEPTQETLLYCTDSYYLPHTFPGINYWLVECNYIEDIINQRLAESPETAFLRKRLMTSHMSLRRLLDALKANDLSKTRMIILVHLSDSNSDERQMVSSIHAQTGIETVAATNGAVIELELAPF
ncbi:MAG: MBL fold metallo-hydrolase [Dehalococcoidia bacterium]|jgi:phosphoribosyl 1,2-cyclic phosphodiesterase